MVMRKISPQLNHLKMTENGVTFSSTYKLKMIKQGWFPFHQKKHKKLEKIQNQDTDCELKKFCLNNKNEIIINDYTSVREVQPNFQKILKKRQFVTIAHINNESELYDIVNITGIIHNLEPVEKNKITYEKLPCKAKPKTYLTQYLTIWFLKLIMKYDSNINGSKGLKIYDNTIIKEYRYYHVSSFWQRNEYRSERLERCKH